MRPLAPFFPLASLLAVLLAGAGAVYVKGRNPSRPERPYRVVKTGGGFPRSFIAADGARVVLAAPPRRVVALSLQAEEILVELAGIEILAAATDKARDPFISHIAAAAARLPATVSGNSAERIARLRPELVLVTSFTDRRGCDFLERCRVPVVILPTPEGLGAIDDTIRLIGDLLGKEEAAAALLESLERRLAAVQGRLPSGISPEILYYSDLGAPWVAGAGTILDEIIRLAGCANLAARRGIIGSRTVQKEILVRWNPQHLLIEGEEEDRERLLDGLRRDPVLRSVAAVRAGKLAVLPTRTITSVSHHVIEAVEKLAAQARRWSEGR
ncbi:MAG: ABC transporter substrate-binding protein [Planctomycetes bacterium]|nr:ABC transporter substrate-binding protein [Planctomycetota bacterium]